MMVPEAPLEASGQGLAPRGEGWFVLNTQEARWLDGEFGAFTRFEGAARFTKIGMNIGVLEPGQPSCMYHREDEQENFLVLSGECLLLIEGEERRLRAWDFVHCPPWTDHVFVGSGEGSCTILAIGSRTGGEVVYPESEVALRHRAGVEAETREPDEAYSGATPDLDVPFPAGSLPG